MTDDAEDNALATAHLDTLAIRAGIARTGEGEHAEPVFLTSSYIFDSAADAAARFAGEAAGNVYSRYTNPTVRTFEQRIAALEGGEQAVGTASGMAAILSTCMALLKSGDHVICSRNVFGTTVNLFGKYLAKFGVEVTFVPLLALDDWRSAVRPNTAMLQTPLALGGDIVVHSATKYLDGQGRCVGGAVVGSAQHMAEVVTFLRTCGPTMSAFNAWVFLKGLETLRLRMDAHSRSALELATWLQQQDAVEQVFYAGLPDHPGHDLAAQQQRAFGGVLSFRVRGGRQQAWDVIDAVRIMSHTANLGDAKTTIVHPATTTHGRLSQEDRASAGITDNLIRVAVGLEHVDDLRADLERGLSTQR